MMTALMTNTVVLYINFTIFFHTIDVLVFNENGVSHNRVPVTYFFLWFISTVQNRASKKDCHTTMLKIEQLIILQRAYIFTMISSEAQTE